MFTQAETRAVARQLYHVWFPQIVYNHHKPGAFPARIWVPPFENPVNPNLDPEIVTSLNFIGEAMKNRFNQEGKPGVVSGWCTTCGGTAACGARPTSTTCSGSYPRPPDAGT